MCRNITLKPLARNFGKKANFIKRQKTNNINLHVYTDLFTQTFPLQTGLVFNVNLSTCQDASLYT